MRYFILSIILISSHAYSQSMVGLGYGSGSPDNIKGLRLNYQYQITNYAKINFNIDGSYAYYHTKGEKEHVHALALSPIANIKVLTSEKINFSFMFGIGPCYRSNPQIGDKMTGSHWTFQDMIGFEMDYKNIKFGLYYLHYSNAGIAKPNPGTDIEPFISISYKF